MKLKNNVWIGLISGLVAPFLAFALYVKFKYPEDDLIRTISSILNLGILSSIISLTLIVNLLVFFIFIWSNADRSAKGVLGATFLYGFTILYLKFLA